MNNLFEQSSGSLLTNNQRIAIALEGIWKELAKLNEGKANDSVNEDNDLAEVDISVMPVEIWSDSQKQEAKQMLLSKRQKRGYRLDKDKVIKKWLQWSWNDYCDKVVRYKTGQIARKPKLHEWAVSIGLIPDDILNSNYKRILCWSSKVLTEEQYDNYQKVEID